jgi:hypothetical protein
MRLSIATAALSVVAALISSAPAQVKTPVIIKDINTLGDGHGGQDPPIGMPLYAQTQSSYPDNARVIGNRVFFLAERGSGKRGLFRYDPLDAAATVAQIGVGLAHPRMPTVVGNTLYFVVGDSTDYVYAVDDKTETKVDFAGAPTITGISALADTGTTLAVLAIEQVGPSVYHTLWLLGTSGTLEKQVQATKTYLEPENLVAFTGAYAFSAKSGSQRAVVRISGGSFLPDTAVGNPAFLTPTTTGLYFVDLGAAGADDYLNWINLYSNASPGDLVFPIASSTGIRHLHATGSTLDRVVFAGGVHTNSPTVETHGWLSGGHKVLMPADASRIVAVASVVPLGDTSYVLGVKDLGGKRTTTVWVQTSTKSSLDEVATFPDLVAPGSLTGFLDPVPRLAFFAALADPTSLLPQLVVSPSTGTGGYWDRIPVLRTRIGTMPDGLRHAGDQLFFSAAELDRGTEPWSCALR